MLNDSVKMAKSQCCATVWIPSPTLIGMDTPTNASSVTKCSYIISGCQCHWEAQESLLHADCYSQPLLTKLLRVQSRANDSAGQGKRGRHSIDAGYSLFLGIQLALMIQLVYLDVQVYI